MLGGFVFIALSLLFASYVVYPLCLALMAKVFHRHEHAAAQSSFSVDLVIAAYNEVSIIEQKILNSLCLDYPKGAMRIHVFSDGSTDGTDECVLKYRSAGVKLHRFEGRLGKTHAQNVLAESLCGDVLVFSDANTMFQPQAIRALVGPFSDTRVAASIGHRIYTGPHQRANQEGLYERFENWLKANETQIGGTIGACGAIYAVRRDDYQSLPRERISDIVEPLRQLCAGKRVVYVADAIGEETLDNDYWREIGRKRRIVVRTLNSLWAERGLLLGQPAVLGKLCLHKIIRWLTLPLLFVIAVAGSFSHVALWQVAGLIAGAYLIVSASMYAYACHCRRIERPLPGGPISGLILYAFGVFLSASLALWDFLGGRNIVIWESRQ